MKDGIAYLLFYIPIILTTILVGLVVLVNSNEDTIVFNMIGFGMFLIATIVILVGTYTGWDFL